MADGENGEVRRCVVGALVMQRFTTMQARRLYPQVRREDVAFAAGRARLPEPSP